MIREDECDKLVSENKKLKAQITQLSAEVKEFEKVIAIISQEYLSLVNKNKDIDLREVLFLNKLIEDSSSTQFNYIRIRQSLDAGFWKILKNPDFNRDFHIANKELATPNFSLSLMKNRGDINSYKLIGYENADDFKAEFIIESTLDSFEVAETIGANNFNYLMSFDTLRKRFNPEISVDDNVVIQKNAI
ncbi:MAG: hypothetical protein WD491_00520 [Balneolales bacterium]